MFLNLSKLISKEKKLTYKNNKILKKGILFSRGLLLFRLGINEKVVENLDSEDIINTDYNITSFEGLSNKVYIEGKNKFERLEQSIIFINRFIKILKKMKLNKKVRILLIENNLDEYNFRFHLIRENETYFSDDYENYENSVLSLDIDI